MNYIQSLRSFVGTRPIIATGSAILVFNEKNELLLQLRRDTNDWGVPGGGMELGDSFEETAHKELLEETGLVAGELELIAIASGKEFYYKYPHGDEVYNATAIFKAVNVSGELVNDGLESKELRYFPLHSLPNLNYTTMKFLQKVGFIRIEQVK